MGYLACAKPTQRSARGARGTVDARVGRLAARQQGVFSRAQARRLGATKRVTQHRVAAGRWEVITRGVYGVVGSPDTWRRTLVATWLAWGSGAVVSHSSSACLWTLAGFEPGPVEVTVPRARRRHGPGVVRRNTLAKPDVTRFDGILVTTVPRTLLDLAATTARDCVEEALDDALRRRLVTVPRMRAHLARWSQSRIAGVRALRALLDARDPQAAAPQSVFESGSSGR